MIDTQDNIDSILNLSSSFKIFPKEIIVAQFLEQLSKTSFSEEVRESVSESEEVVGDTPSTQKFPVEFAEIIYTEEENNYKSKSIPQIFRKKKYSGTPTPKHWKSYESQLIE